MSNVLRRVGVSALVLCAAGAVSASAQEIVFTGEAAPLTVFQSYLVPAEGEDAAVQNVDVEDMHVLGIVSADGDQVQGDFAAVLISNSMAAEEPETENAADEGQDAGEEAGTDASGEVAWITGFVSVDELMTVAPAIALDELPSVSGWTDLAPGASGDAVMTAQDCLQKLGFLSGAVDGQFGQGTAGAVLAFQQENSLPQTGSLDVITWMFIQEKAAGKDAIEQPYPPVFTVEDKFQNILEDVADPAVLEEYVTPEWRYTYDAFEGEGLISDGTVVGTFEDSSRPVDTISMTVSQAVKVKRSETGAIDVYPILLIESAGAYRPYVKGAIIKSGNAVCEVSDAEISGKLSGTQVEETGEIELTDEDVEAIEAMKNADADGTAELEIRVLGNSRTFDINCK